MKTKEWHTKIQQGLADDIKLLLLSHSSTKSAKSNTTNTITVKRTHSKDLDMDRLDDWKMRPGVCFKERHDILDVFKVDFLPE